MATYKVRGNSHCVIFPYKTETGKVKQQWETYTTELEAMQRQQVFIEYLQRSKNQEAILQAVNEYKDKRAEERVEKEAVKNIDIEVGEVLEPSTTDNLHKTYREFAQKWLPFHARKNRFSPNTYDAYLESLNLHILPYFGDRIMSKITSLDIDAFLDHMSRKPCKGSKSYNKSLSDIPTLSSSSIKKHYNVFISGLATAKNWGYIREIPHCSAPAEKQKKRKAWDSQTIYQTLCGIEDKTLHLAVHIAFVCSLRAGETSAIDLNSINLQDRSFWIKQEIQRVSDKALKVLPQNEIIRVFPKQVNTSKSHMILKAPKTEGSYRKLYLTTPLIQEIKERIEEIEKCKTYYGADYQDYGLLICQPDGRPIEPHSFSRSFKAWQTKLGIPANEQIEFQGLRKSGQMHKVRLSQNNYQLVAESSGQSPEVLMSNYNEALETEKRTLSMLVETNFYPGAKQEPKADSQPEAAAIMHLLQENPELSKQLLQLIQGCAVS